MRTDCTHFFEMQDKLRIIVPDVTLVLLAGEKDRKRRLDLREQNTARDYDFAYITRVQDELVRCMQLPAYKSRTKRVIDTSDVHLPQVVEHLFKTVPELSEGMR